MMEAGTFGGPAKNLLNTIELMRGRADCCVVTFLRGREESSEFIRAMEDRQIHHVVIRERFRYDPRALTSLRKLIRQYRPDVLQIHNIKSRLYANVLRWTRTIPRAPMVDCYHGETWVDRKQLVYNWIDRRLFRKAKHIVAVSERQRQLLADIGVPHDRVTVIYNGISLHPEVDRPPNETLCLLTIGRLSLEKGHRLLLDVVTELRRRGRKGFEVVIVGDGPEMDALRGQAASQNLNGLVRFEGYQTDPNSYYRKADLLVLPSLSEGIPNVLLEAAMFGVPIVSTNVGGVPEMFRDGAEALLVAPDDVTALTDAIERCLDDTDLRRQLAQNARQRVLDAFTVEQRVERFLEYYAALVRRD